MPSYGQIPQVHDEDLDDVDLERATVDLSEVNTGIEKSDGGNNFSEGKELMSSAKSPELPKKSDTKNKGDASRIVSLSRPEWAAMGFATFCLLITQVGGMAVPWFFGQLIDITQDDSLTVEERRSKMVDIIITLICIQSVASVMLFFRGFIFNASGERVVARLRIRLFKAILSQEIAFFDQKKTGELLSRLSNDTSKLQDAATSSVSIFIRQSITIVISVIMLFATSWQLTSGIIFAVPLLVFVATTYGRYVKGIAKKYTDALAVAADVSNESIGNIRTARAFAGEDLELIKFSKMIGDPDNYHGRTIFSWFPPKESNTTYNLGIKKAVGHGTFIGCMGGLAQFTFIGLLWFGGELILSEKMSPGKLITYMMYAMQMGIALAMFSGLFSSFMESIGASKRTFEIIDRVPEFPIRGGEFCQMGGMLEFQNVNFSYPSRMDVPVLENFSLKIEKNTTVALVGQSGGGKSTVIWLLERFYDVNSGRILIDGQDIKELDPSIMRLGMGLVSQEPVLFGVSIFDNIAYGYNAKFGVDRKPSLAEIEKVAKAANADEFIEKFPEGYRTLVGERGVKLSGGQKQRIAIARALLIDPKILLLDEATSALDSQSEELVQEAIDRVMVGRTVVVVAHRLSTVKNADQIVLLQDRNIVDKGNHDDLLKRCADYRSLVAKQLQSDVSLGGGG